MTGCGGNVDHEVVRPLKLGHDSQHREEEAQIRRHGRLEQDLPVGQALDLKVEGIDGPVALGQQRIGVAVAVKQRLGRHGQALSDHRE